MSVKIKTQNDYLLTEVAIALPTNLSDLAELMKTLKATGRIVVMFSNGGIFGVSVEQRLKLKDADSKSVREALSIGSIEL